VKFTSGSFIFKKHLVNFAFTLGFYGLLVILPIALARHEYFFMDFGKKVLIVSKGTVSKGQMAEAYFRCYANNGNFTSVSLENDELHPVSIRVMAEDNIDLTQFQPKSIEEVKDQKFDYLITLGAETKVFDQGIKATQQLTFTTPEFKNLNLEEPELIQVLRETRDMLKKDILKFIGKNLLEEGGSNHMLTT
jgi:arsenate reductase (thioredoxin)